MTMVRNKEILLKMALETPTYQIPSPHHPRAPRTPQQMNPPGKGQTGSIPSTPSMGGQGDPPSQSHMVGPDKARPGPHSARRGCRAKPRLTLASGGPQGPPSPGECWSSSFCARLSVRGQVFSSDEGPGLGWGSPVRQRDRKHRQAQNGMQDVDGTVSRNPEAT